MFVYLVLFIPILHKNRQNALFCLMGILLTPPPFIKNCTLHGLLINLWHFRPSYYSKIFLSIAKDLAELIEFIFTVKLLICPGKVFNYFLVRVFLGKEREKMVTRHKAFHLPHLKCP